MKKLLILLSLAFAATFARGAAGDIITATVTITNLPVSGDTLTVNAATRTWTNAVSPTQFLIATNIGGAATNLFNQIAAYPYSGLVESRVGTNGISLQTIVGGALSVTATGTNCSIVFSTNSSIPSQAVRVPMTSYTVQSDATNHSSLLVTALATYPTNLFPLATPALGNYVDLSSTQVISGKLINASTFNGTFEGTIYYPALYQTNVLGLFNGIGMGDSGGTLRSILGVDTNGFPTIWSLSAFPEPPLSTISGPASILTEASADTRYGGLAAANAWTGTNYFAQITNTVGKGLTLTLSTYSGNIGALTNGSLSSVTTSNMTFAGSNVVSGSWAVPWLTNNTLAAGGNADLDWVQGSRVILTGGPAGGFSIDGIKAGSAQDGYEWQVWNQTSQVLTLANESGVEATPARRIQTLTGANVVLTTNCIATLSYSTLAARWILLSHQP